MCFAVGRFMNLAKPKHSAVSFAKYSITRERNEKEKNAYAFYMIKAINSP